MKIDILHTTDCSITSIPLKKFTFSGGEEHVQVDASAMLNNICQGDRVIIHHEVRSGNDFMVLVMTKNAIDNILNFIPHTTELVMFYVPYARQDRVCEKGEANGIRAFADALNALNFDRITVADPHSNVTPAVINNLFVIPQEEIAYHALKGKLVKEDFALVSPDGGALKKIFKLSKMMGLEVHCAEKIRDTKTGAIIKTDIPTKDFKGKNLMIVDDICDNGGTFLALGKLLKERNAGRVELYVTHGIFGKGIDIFDGIIDSIHCFNAWENNIDNRNTKGILVENQEVLQKGIVK